MHVCSAPPLPPSPPPPPPSWRLQGAANQSQYNLPAEEPAHFVCHPHMHSWAMRGASAPSAHVDLGIDSIGKAELINHTMLDYTEEGVSVGAGEYLAFGKLTVSAHSSFAFWVSPTGGSSPATLYALRNSATGAELRLRFSGGIGGGWGPGTSGVDTYDAEGNKVSHDTFGTTIPMPLLTMGGWNLVTVVTAPPLLSLYVDGGLALEVHLPCCLDPSTSPLIALVVHPLYRATPLSRFTPYAAMLP